MILIEIYRMPHLITAECILFLRAHETVIRIIINWALKKPINFKVLNSLPNMLCNHNKFKLYINNKNISIQF